MEHASGGGTRRHDAQDGPALSPAGSPGGAGALTERLQAVRRAAPGPSDGHPPADRPRRAALRHPLGGRRRRAVDGDPACPGRRTRGEHRAPAAHAPSTGRGPGGRGIARPARGLRGRRRQSAAGPAGSPGGVFERLHADGDVCHPGPVRTSPDGIAEEFEQLPADAPEDERRRLAGHLAAEVRAQRADHSFITDLDAASRRNGALTRSVVTQALVEFYNGAQLGVLRHLHALLEQSEADQADQASVADLAVEGDEQGELYRSGDAHPQRVTPGATG